MQIDPKRTVKAARDQVEGGLGGQDTHRPGEMIPVVRLVDGVKIPWGYTVFCPGCAERLSLQTSEPGPRWTASGDLDAGTLTLTPSIHHQQGCGWHGHLVDGTFIPV